MRKLFSDIFHYLSLFIVFILAFTSFRFFPFDRFMQVGIAVATSAAYIVWGIVHHAIHRDLSLSVILEYIVIGSLGLVVTFSLILRA